jgi:SAM-dependent methyltransferase
VKIVVVSPVYRNAGTLPALAAAVHEALAGHDVVLRLVVDASPDDSAEVAAALPGVAVTVLPSNAGQHRALARGLLDEPDADAWVCLDADLQDPPSAIPALLAALPGHDVVFAGRRGAYEGRGRRLTGDLHRGVLRLLTGLPPDAGAFFAVSTAGREALLAGMDRGCPSVVAALGAARLRVVSVPVHRDVRTVGVSSWTARARVRQSARTLWWAARRRLPDRQRGLRSSAIAAHPAAMDFTAAGWDARYGERERIWTGHVNAVLADEVADLAPGRALDVGCGEGADALWLAARGWEVTGVDISSVALGRAVEEAAARGLSVTWQRADLLVSPPAMSSYELVSAHFLQLTPDERAGVHAALGAAVVPGGTLLVVAHHPAHLPASGHHGVPERFFTASEVLADLGPGWDVVVAEERVREGVRPDGERLTFHDTVVRVVKQ